MNFALASCPENKSYWGDTGCIVVMGLPERCSWGVMRMVNSRTWNVNQCSIILVYNFKLRQFLVKLHRELPSRFCRRVCPSNQQNWLFRDWILTNLWSLGSLDISRTNYQLTYLKCKPMFDYSGLQFQTSSISRQITPGTSFSVLSTSLSIQPAELIVQGLDFDESLIIGITWHKSNKLSTYVPNKVGEREGYVNIDFSFYK